MHTWKSPWHGTWLVEVAKRFLFISFMGFMLTIDIPPNKRNRGNPWKMKAQSSEQKSTSKVSENHHVNCQLYLLTFHFPPSHNFQCSIWPSPWPWSSLRPVDKWVISNKSSAFHRSPEPESFCQWWLVTSCTFTKKKSSLHGLNVEQTCLVWVFMPTEFMISTYLYVTFDKHQHLWKIPRAPSMRLRSGT